jgi:hypothetical protein
VTQAIIFVDAERGANDLVVTFRRDHSPDRLPWNDFKSIGTPATNAVVAAGWSCRALDQMAESVRFIDGKLDELREEARDKRKADFYP